MTDESGSAPEWQDAWIDALDIPLNTSDTARLRRVIRALADAGLIDECHVFVGEPAPRLASIRRLPVP